MPVEIEEKVGFMKHPQSEADTIMRTRIMKRKSLAFLDTSSLTTLS